MEAACARFVDPMSKAANREEVLGYIIEFDEVPNEALGRRSKREFNRGQQANANPTG